MEKKPITTIEECMKALTSKETSEASIRELIEYHVKAALESASFTLKKKKFDYGRYSTRIAMVGDKDDIINSYPLTNIK